MEKLDLIFLGACALLAKRFAPKGNVGMTSYPADPNPDIIRQALLKTEEIWDAAVEMKF